MKPGSSRKFLVAPLVWLLTHSIIDVCSCFWEKQVIAWSDLGDCLITHGSRGGLDLGGINVYVRGFFYQSWNFSSWQIKTAAFSSYG